MSASRIGQAIAELLQNSADVTISSPANGDILVFNSATGQWVNGPVSSSGGVPNTRRIDTTSPLTGGGDLSADRTLGITGSALTKTDDTNVILTLGGTPTSALLTAASLTLGWAGQLSVGRGGTGANLSATGGTSQVLKQSSVGAAITVAQLAASDLSNGTTGSGAVVLAGTPTLTTAVLGSSTATTQTANDNSTKVATTAYVDNAISGTNYKEAVKYGSVAALPSIVYANGSSGVGATLTGVALAAISLDGASPGVGDRILIKNQVSDFQNGIYVVTQTGSGIAVFILTRATDFDQAADIRTGDTVFVTAGNTLANTLWSYSGIDSPTMGTTSLAFVQVSADLIVGQSVILSGTTTRILYDNAGILGEYTITGTGTVVVMQGSPTITTPSITTGFTIGGAAASGKFIVGNGTNFVASTSTIPTSAGSTANKVLLSDGTNYVLSTPTFPNASATSGKITISDGTNWIASTTVWPNALTAGSVLYASATNTVGQDNTNFFWDNVNQGLSIKSATQSALTVTSTYTGAGSLSNAAFNWSQNHGTITSSTTFSDVSVSFSPTITQQNTSVTLNGTLFSLDLSGVTIGTTASAGNTFVSKGFNGTISGTIIWNDPSKANSSTGELTGGIFSVTNQLTTTSVGTVTFNSYGVKVSNSTSLSAGVAALTYSAYGASLSVTGGLTTTGTTAKYGAYTTVTGSAVNNYGIYIDTVSGATNNYGLYVATTANTYIGSTNINLNTFTSNGGPLYTDGSGLVKQVTAGTSTQVLHGGTGPSFSAVSLTADVTGTLPVANGGTNQTSYTDGQLLIGNTTGNTLAKATLTGTANQVVVTNGHGTITLSTPQDIASGSSPTFTGLTLSGLTAGSVVYAGTSGVLSQDNANFFWDATNHRLGIGTASPTVDLEVGSGGAATFPILRINGGTNSGVGPTLRLARGGTVKGQLGTSSIILGDNSDDIVLYTNGTNSFRWYVNGAEAMRIAGSTGNVGIGVSPSTLLHVSKSQTADTEIRVNNANSGASARSMLSLNADTASIYMIVYGSGASPASLCTWYAASNSEYRMWNSSNTAMTFYTNNAETMRLSAAGNLGIGTNSPTTFMLEMGGNIGPHADATYDIGTGTVRMRAIYINDAVRAGAGNFAFFKALAGNDVQFGDSGWRDLIAPSTSSNVFRPAGNKTQDNGATGTRWANLYYSAATTGTSRLCDSNTICPKDGSVMKRGTGTNYILGEDGDYIQVWCVICYTTMIEKISHLPSMMLSQRQPAPMIKFLGFRVKQLSGNARHVYVDFQYEEDTVTQDYLGNDIVTKGLHNSTILGESEVTALMGMTEDEHKTFLLDLGQREWDSLEEVRIMKESLVEEQRLFDDLLDVHKDQDLLTPAAK